LFRVTELLVKETLGCADYRKVTLKVAEITYIESRDTEVWIHAADGRSFRNKTPITQWQNILENGFIRIHRSYLVNGSFITSYDNESVTVNEKNPPDFKKEPGGSHQDDQF
jgi:DNA-binding LytR/AlgR family response regulator